MGVGACRYLGVYPVDSRHFKWNWDNWKSRFYRSFNPMNRRTAIQRLVNLLYDY